VIDAAKSIAEAHGTSVARVALSWLLTRPFVTSLIIGAKKIDQLRDNLSASTLQLTREQIGQLDKVSALPLEYPGWMLEWQQRDRSPEFELMKDLKPPSERL
jgi:aryl-alcohol dehydrogenase-like predicted oxidoreductase